MTDVILEFGQTITLDSDGNGSMRLGPNRPNTLWHITNTAVTNTSTGLIPQAIVYRGTVAPANQFDGTFTGTNDSSDSVLDLYFGQFITVAWIKGDPNSVSTATVYGTVKVL